MRQYPRHQVLRTRPLSCLGAKDITDIEDLGWLAANGKRELISDIFVAIGALRAAVAGARTNLSFNLASLTSKGEDEEPVREQHTVLRSTVGELHTALTAPKARISWILALDPAQPPAPV